MHACMRIHVYIYDRINFDIILILRQIILISIDMISTSHVTAVHIYICRYACMHKLYCMLSGPIIENQIRDSWIKRRDSWIKRRFPSINYQIDKCYDSSKCKNKVQSGFVNYQTSFHFIIN